MKTWPFLINPFLTAAKKSYIQALKISAYHDAQLQAHISDGFYAGMYEIYHPLHLALNTSYSRWQTQGGTQKGSTLTTDQLLKLLITTKMTSWEYGILGVFAKGTPGFVAIFPNGRYPFNNGSKEMRIAAVKQLSDALAGIAGLEATKIDVDRFYSQLTAKPQVQLGKKGIAENKCDMVEADILAAMEQMYGNLGLIMNRFKSSPTLIETFFDIETIRNHDQLVFKKKVKSEKVSNLMEHTFGAEDSVTLINDGKAPLQFYLAQTATTTAPVVMPLILFPNTQQTLTVNSLGDLTNKFLNVYNGEINDGHCTLEMI